MNPDNGSTGIGAVLVVTPWYRPLVGGVAAVSEQLHRGFQDRGIESHLLVLSEDRSLTTDPRDPTIHRMLVPSYALSSLRPRALAGMARRAPVALGQLANFIRERGIRSLLLVYPLDHAWAFLLLARTLDVRLVVSLHGGDIKRFPTRSRRTGVLFRALTEGAEHVVLCDEHLLGVLERHSPGAKSRALVIPNAVDTDYFRPAEPGAGPLPPAAGPVTFLHVSNFHPYKRTVDIVEAFAAMRKVQGDRLIMVGDGTDRSVARKRAEDLDVGDRVTFPGKRDDVRPFFAQADLFLLASESEGAPLVIPEAMASGLAWISTPWGAAREIDDGVCGIRVPVGDHLAMARAMEDLARAPARRVRMAARAREIAVARYDLQGYMDRHLHLLAQD